MARKAKNISDRELRQLLSSFKEEVAAPPHFRARLISRIAADRGLEAPQESLSLAQRLTFWLRPALVPTAVGLIMAFAVWTVVKEPKADVQAPQIAEVKTAGSQDVAAGSRRNSDYASGGPAANPKVGISNSEVAVVEKKAPIAVAPKADTQVAPAAVVSSPAPGEMAPGQALALRPTPAASNPNIAPVFGSSGGSAPSSSAPSASMASQDKPIIIEITPTKTPLAVPLKGNTEVRGNKILASRGGYCLILFKMDFPGTARVEVYDRLGRLVDVPLDSMMQAGVHELKWHGHNRKGELNATGVYLIRIKAGRVDERHKVVIVK